MDFQPWQDRLVSVLRVKNTMTNMISIPLKHATGFVVGAVVVPAFCEKAVCDRWLAGDSLAEIARAFDGKIEFDSPRTTLRPCHGVARNT